MKPNVTTAAGGVLRMAAVDGALWCMFGLKPKTSGEGVAGVGGGFGLKGHEGEDGDP